MNPIRYLQIGVVLLLVSSGFYIKHLLNEQESLIEENLVLETQIKTNEANLKILTNLLDEEKEHREAAEEALLSLKDVPDVEYSQNLPPNIQTVLDRFHARVRPTNP